MSSDEKRTVFASPFNISYPKSMKKWKKLVQAVTTHLIDRYSMKEVRSWLFTVWSEPDTTRYLFGFDTDEQFYTLYKETYESIKGIDKNLLFGSPAMLASYKHNQLWMQRFITWCHENNCRPDFMNINYYDNDFDIETISNHKPAMPHHSRLNKDEKSFQKCLKLIKNLFADMGIQDLPVFLTEWNLTVSHRNLINDTCFKSCYIAKNLLENYDELDSFGYWVLTDLNEELQPSNNQFHGGLGLFTIDGIKKPHYHLFRMLTQLGDMLVDKGDGYFISKSEGKIQICLYNYEHFNHLFALGESYDMTFTERYTPFSKQGKMDVSLLLTGIDGEKCIIREEILNQNSGSAFDEWIKMGAMELSAQDIEYLKNISIPRIHIYKTDVKDKSISINVSMAPLEVRFILITLL